MDMFNKATSALSGDKNDEGNQQGQGEKKQGGGGLMDKFNGMAGGGQQGEKDEDVLDKGVDMFQERVMGQGPQNNEGAVEQAKDEQISDFIRDKYKSTTGSDFPIQDKDKSYGKD